MRPSSQKVLYLFTGSDVRIQLHVMGSPIRRSYNNVDIGESQRLAFQIGWVHRRKERYVHRD